ncbi:MAG: methyltransferase domain-containing protein [Anaerolineae bacterium]|nr:methyltransferase domain-containing protein [Anaerolineae bacterium]
MVEIHSTILDLGCGNNKRPGAWGVDIAECQADQRFSLDETPWPLPDDHFTIVYAIQVLEHLESRTRTMEEIWRVCQHGALVVVSVPDGCCPGYVQDPTHRSPWNIGTFLYFCPEQFIKGSEMPPYEIQAHFRVLDYHVRERSSTPWGEQWYADDLWALLQAIKEE